MLTCQHLPVRTTCCGGASLARRPCCRAGGSGAACTDPNLRQSCSCKARQSTSDIVPAERFSGTQLKGLGEDEFKACSCEDKLLLLFLIRAAFVVERSGGAHIYISGPRQSSHQSRLANRHNPLMWRATKQQRSVKEVAAPWAADEPALYADYCLHQPGNYDWLSG